MNNSSQLPCPVLVSDPEGRVLEVNLDFLEAVGRPEGDIVNQSMELLLPVASRIFLQTHVWPLLMREGRVREIKLHLLTKNGQHLPVLTNCQRTGMAGAHSFCWVFFVSQERSMFEGELLQARKRAEYALSQLRISEAALQQSLRAKEALIKEVHHRVKNNLQVVSSLLRLESARSDTPEVRSVLGSMQGRVQSMSMLHELLYRSGNLAEVDLGSYLRQLANEAFRSLLPECRPVTLSFDMDPLNVGMDQAAPCGLLVIELVANSLKHGFPNGRRGAIRIALHPDPGGATGHWRLCVMDDGVGLAHDFLERSQDSLGLQLVGDLCRQMDGRLDMGPGPQAGAMFSVTFQPHEGAPHIEGLHAPQ